MAKLTPQEQLNKKKRSNLAALVSRIQSAYNFKAIKTWGDVYKYEGMLEADIKATHKDTWQKELTYAELKAHCQELLDKLERSISGTPEPIVIATPKGETITVPVAKVVTSQPEVKAVEQEVKLTAADDYGYVRSPHVSKDFFPYWFQKKEVAELLAGINAGMRAQLMLAATGTGKTFMAGMLVRALYDMNFHDNKSWGPVKYLYVTRATIVEQTKRVFQKYFNLGIRQGIEILNIEQLRSRAGTMWVKDEVVVINGQEQTIWKWHQMIHPPVVLWDECQALKNEGSTQHAIAAAYNDIPDHTTQIFISATPFTRVTEAKCFAVGTRKQISDNLGLGHTSYLSNATWPTYAAAISAPSPPSEYNEAAVERLTKDLEPYIKRVRGVRPQFDAINSIELIDFETDDERKYYEDTERRYYEKKAKLAEKLGKDLGDDGSAGGIWALVLLNERCMAAEYCRRYHLAKKMKHAVDNGYAAVCAVKYKNTLIAVVRILVEEYKISRDLISLVWGGGQTQLTAKQKSKAEIKAQADKLKEIGMDITSVLENLDLDEVEDRVLEEIPAHLRLGMQSKEERQREIDKFQMGKTLFCMYTFKAGGVGLSLHHSDELSPVKVRRKESGYAVEEDIPKVPIRPRANFVAPTYSAIELVQGLGRCPRLTSLSNTPQRLVYYRGTVEEDVARIVSGKLRCLSKVVRQREKWEDVIVSNGASVVSHINNTKDVVDDPDDLTASEEDDE